MIPFTYLLLLLQSIAGRIVLYLHPIERSSMSAMQIGSVFLLGLLTPERTSIPTGEESP